MKKHKKNTEKKKKYRDIIIITGNDGADKANITIAMAMIIIINV